MTSKRLSKAPSQGKPQIVISDTSCLIDLRKVRLLHDMLRLPYRFALALPLQRDEMLDLKEEEWASLESAGLGVIDLDGKRVTDALLLQARHAQLSAVDCLSLALARSFSAAILLTGDAQLRSICEGVYQIETHGILWVTDELMQHNLVASSRIQNCLERWRDDPAVFIPAATLTARLKRVG